MHENRKQLANCTKKCLNDILNAKEKAVKNKIDIFINDVLSKALTLSAFSFLSQIVCSIIFSTFLSIIQLVKVLAFTKNIRLTYNELFS